MAKKSTVNKIDINGKQPYLNAKQFNNYDTKIVKNALSLSSEHRNVFSAMHLYINSADVKQDKFANNLSSKPTSLSTLLSSLPGTSSVPKTVEQQAISYNETKKQKLVLPMKRKHLFIDSGIAPKKKKYCDVTPVGTTLPCDQTSTTPDIQHSNSSVLDSTDKSSFSSIRNYADEERNIETNNSFTTNKFENLRKFSSDSDRKTEYETGYDSMTECREPSKLDVFNMYDLFTTDNSGQLHSPDNISLSSSDDFPTFANDYNSKPSDNAISSPSKPTTYCDEEFQSFDNGIYVTSDEEVHNPEQYSESLHGSSFSEEVVKDKFNQEHVSSEDFEITSTPKSQNLTEACSTPESTSLLLQRLNEACHKVVLTPRHAKQKAIDLPHDEVAILSEVSTYKGDSNGPRRKITFTLNRLLKDKRESEDLKSMEQNLLADVKKGGFSRFLNKSGDDDSDYVKDKTYHNLKRLSLRSQLVFIKENPNIIGKHLCCYDRNFDGKAASSLLITWLLQILTTSDDLCELASSALLALLQNSCFQVERTDGFHEALANLGIKAKYLKHLTRFTETTSRCEKCKKRKYQLSATFKKLPFVLKVFVQLLSNRPCVIADAELCRLVLILVLLLSKKDRTSLLKPLLSNSITHALRALRHWQEMRFLIVQDIMNNVTDIHTLQYIVSALPLTSQRTTELRRCLVLAALKRHVQGSATEQHYLDAVESGNIEEIASMAAELSVDIIRAVLESNDNDVTNLKVFNTLWFCVLLLQSYVGVQSEHKRYKESLESITKSLCSLNLAIRENGCLYCSAVKHHIRLVTAVAEIQLQKMSKSRLYQQGIFKYLRASKVDEVYVESRNSPEDRDSAFDDSPEESSLNEIGNTSSNDKFPDHKLQKSSSVIDVAPSSDQPFRSSVDPNDVVLPQIVAAQHVDMLRPCFVDLSQAAISKSVKHVKTTEPIPDLQSNAERNITIEHPNLKSSVECIESAWPMVTTENKAVKPGLPTRADKVEKRCVVESVTPLFKIDDTVPANASNIVGAKKLITDFYTVTTKRC